MSLFGTVAYERAYYHCADCSRGYFPTDHEFGIVDLKSPAARELICLAGVLEPFGESGETVLPRLSGLEVSTSTVQRTTEKVGADVATRRTAGEVFGNEAPWKWSHDAAGQLVAYVSLDATGVLQQAARGLKADGRMAWVAAVFNPHPKSNRKKRRKSRPQLRQSRYVSGLMSLPEIGTQLRHECEVIGISRAEVVIGLTDGGQGLEDCLLAALGGLTQRIVFILDFYHVTEHLREFAKVWIFDEDARKKHVKEWCQMLKHSGGERLFAELSALPISRAKPLVKQSHQQLLGYLRHNLHRMDYPHYIAHGWQIGSGVIEAACKTVIGRRLKCSGMRWSERQTTPMCQLRALYRSSPNLWADYWQRISRKTHLSI